MIRQISISNCIHWAAALGAVQEMKEIKVFADEKSRVTGRMTVRKQLPRA